MDDFLGRGWHDLVGRLHGPMFARLLVQPAVAAILAIRAGLRDVREGRGPYLWRIASDPGHRSQDLRQGWKDAGKLFLVALVLDVIYQLMVLRWVYVGEAIVVATVLALVPYVVVRSLIRRVAAHRGPDASTAGSKRGDPHV